MSLGTEKGLPRLFSLLGLVLGRIGDDDKISLQLPIRREDFPQLIDRELIDRGLLSQESSIARLAMGIPQTEFKTFPRRLDPLLNIAPYLRLFGPGLRRKPCVTLLASTYHPVMAPASLMLVGMV